MVNYSVKQCRARGASVTVPSPGVVLDCCHGNARGNAARAGGITPGWPGLIMKRVTFKHVARIWPGGGA